MWAARFVLSLSAAVALSREYSAARVLLKARCCENPQSRTPGQLPKRFRRLVFLFRRPLPEDTDETDPGDDGPHTLEEQKPPLGRRESGENEKRSKDLDELSHDDLPPMSSCQNRVRHHSSESREALTIWKRA